MSSDTTQFTVEETVTLSHELTSFRSIPEINIESIKLTPHDLQGENNLIDVLHARFAGLQISTSSGSPGASVSSVLRGRNSVLNDNAPLIILDGIPVNNTEWGNGNAGVDLSNRLVDINPMDIETVTLLKGPLASVIYGVRGGSGVIVLTTKTGAGPPLVNIQTSLISERVSTLPNRQSEFAQGRFLSGSVQWRGPHTKEGFSWGPSISDLEFDGSVYDYDLNGRLVARGTGNGLDAKAYDPYSFFVNSTSYKLDASVSGGSEKTNYYVSISHAKSNGPSPNANFGQSGFFGKLNTSITSRFKLGLSGHITNSTSYRLQKGANIRGVMLGLLRTTPTFDNGNGKSGRDAADDPNTYELANSDQRSYRGGVYDNPFWTINKNPFEDNVLRLIGNLSLRYEVSDWLALKGQLGIDTYNDKRHGGIDINPGIFGGSAFDTKVDYNGLNGNLFALIHRPISTSVNMNAKIGFDYFHSEFNDRTESGEDFILPGIFDLSNTISQDTNLFMSSKKIAGAYALVDFNYKDFLLFDLSVRNDWSSALPENNRTFLSYAFSSGFVISSLPGFDNSGAVNLIKIYAGYGRVANDAPSNLTESFFVPGVIRGDPYFFGSDEVSFSSGNGYQMSDILGNDQLRPETTTSIESGLEVGLLDNRIGFGLKYYYQDTKDVIMWLNLAGSSGYKLIAANAGQINNTGIEIFASGRALDYNKFKWDISLNFNRSKNKVLEVPEEAQDIILSGFSTSSSRVIEEAPYGVIYGNGFQRNDDGQVLIDAEGWPIWDLDLKVLGDPNPDWTLNLQNDFRIVNNLAIGLDIEIKQGGDMWCGTCGVMDYFGISLQAANERGEAVVFEGVLPNGNPNNIPVSLADPDESTGEYYRVRYGFGGITEMSIFDASWVRLRRVSVSYQLSSLFSEDSFVKGLSISLFAKNLWINTKYPGIDPETNLTGASNGFGIDYFNNPGTKSFGTTINLAF